MVVRLGWLTPTRIYLLQVGFASLAYALATTLQVVYQIKVIGLGPLQLVLIGTVLEATVLLCEIPTGVVADRYSRRLSIILGAALSGAGFLVHGLSPTFTGALVCSVVWGIGFAFISGAGQAWLVDEIGETDALPAFTKARQVDLAVTIVGIVLAAGLGLVYLGLPLIVAGGVFLALAVVLSMVMTEDGWKPTPVADQATFRALGRQVTDGVRAIRANRIVLTLVGIAFIVGLSSEAFDRLWTNRILTDFVLPNVFGWAGDVIWFTLFALVGTAISLVVSLAANTFARQVMTNDHPNRLLGGLLGMQVMGIVVTAFSPWVGLAVGGVWLRKAAQNLAAPVQAAWINRHLDAQSRATVLSMSSQVDAFGQVAGGPALGKVGSTWGLTAALAGSALVLAPAVMLYLRLRGPHHDERATPTTTSPVVPRR